MERPRHELVFPPWFDLDALLTNKGLEPEQIGKGVPFASWFQSNAGHGLALVEDRVESLDDRDFASVHDDGEGEGLCRSTTTIRWDHLDVDMALGIRRRIPRIALILLAFLVPTHSNCRGRGVAFHPLGR